MSKRLIDLTVALAGLILLFPLLCAAALAIWLQDFRSPLYIAPRGRSKTRTFEMIKLRSMIINAAQKGGASTSVTDPRITWIGKLVRRTKLDEVTQLLNVLGGDMSLVGPRPQVMRDIALYTETECGLFAMRPGITDIASIVFADEGDILKGKGDPDKAYNDLIRPWKSRLGLFYIQKTSLDLDLNIIFLTILNGLNRPLALKLLSKKIASLGASSDLIQIANRMAELTPSLPP